MPKFDNSRVKFMNSRGNKGGCLVFVTIVILRQYSENYIS